MEQSWIIAAGAGALLLIAIVWLVARGRKKKSGEGEPEAMGSGEVRLTEPTLDPVTDPSGPEESNDATADVARDAVSAAAEPADPEQPDPDPVAEDEPYTLPDLDEAVETDEPEKL
ncbi:MAG: hypothetical protein V2I57_11730, partial [Xanthomonadales bacterium]|nr:hypothetical protein [Xanthomonadales bacterium]